MSDIQVAVSTEAELQALAAALGILDASLFKSQGFVAGEWFNSDPQACFAVNNPATAKPLCYVADLGASATGAAIEAAHKAQKSWAAKAPVERSQLLERWYQLIIENRDDLARIMTAEQGKTLAESAGEVNYGASYVKWFAEEAKRIYGDLLPSASDRRGLVIKQPVGVVAAITPWNFPNAMITRKVAPALAAGCTMVLKPAAETPLSALALAELAQRAGIPAGVFNVVAGTQSAAIGSVMTSSPLVRKLTFTGSTRVGKILMRQCADTVKRTSMELGGNAPVLVFDDADLDQAVAGALMSKFRNSGQTCICANRLLVQAGIYDRFVERFTAAVEAFTLGDGSVQGTELGPVITKLAADQIDEKVKRAVDQGARVAVGGQLSALGDHFYEPTVLVDMSPEMEIFSEEIFGPVATLFKFEHESEAIEMANDTPYGLASYLYTQNMARSLRVAEALEYGMVGVNESAISSEVIPFGGIKESGQGREGSKYGLDDYLETKYICLGGLNG